MREYIFMLRKNLFSFEAFRIFNTEKFNYLILIKYRQDYKYLFRH